MRKFLSKIRENLLGKSRISDKEYTRRAMELNEKEKNDPDQAKRNIQCMIDSEQITDQEDKAS